MNAQLDSFLCEIGLTEAERGALHSAYDRLCADHGEGIAPEDLPLVKQMFYKGNSQKRGSGIGLGVADEIIKRHSGSLDIESDLGHGTTVTITLPLTNDVE